MAIRTISTGGGNWSATTTWAEGAVPTANDDVVATGTSGSLTIDATASCRSFDLTGYTGTVTHNAFTLAIGTTTAPVSLAALVFPTTGWTYTLANATLSAISFSTTVAGTTQTVDFGNKTTGNVTFTAPSGSGYRLVNNGFSCGSTATVTHTSGTFNANGQTLNWGTFNGSNGNTRVLTLGNATITLAAGGNSWNMSNINGLTITANTATVIQSGAAAIFTGNTNWNGMSLQLTGSGIAFVNTTNVTFANLTRTATAARTDTLQLRGTITVTASLVLAGNSATSRLFVNASTVGTAVALTVNGSVTASYVDFSDITAAGTASWNLSAIPGGSGDALGNSGITFTAAASQTWQGSTGGNWSDVTKWTSRIPLPQDDATISSAFSATQTISWDMPRLGRNISWAGTTGNPACIANITTSLFGSLTYAGGMTTGGGFSVNLCARSASTVTTNGVLLPIVGIGNAPQCAYTFTDNVTFGSSTNIVGGSASFLGNVTIAVSIVITNSGIARTITMGPGIWTFTATTTSTVWNVATAAGITFNPGASTMVLAGVTANTRTFAGGGLTYNNLTYTTAGSTGRLIITGANTFNTLLVAGGRTITFPASTTTTIASAGGWQINGSNGNRTTINSSSAGSQATIQITSGTVGSDYLSLTDSAVSGGASWYAGGNSINAGNNTGWLFAAAPAGLEYWGMPV